jgi:hypothetical protein
VITDAASNPGTSVTNAVEVAVDTALNMVGLPSDAHVLQWTPCDPVVGDSVWEIGFGDDGPHWTQRFQPENDVPLHEALEALRAAVAHRPARDAA